MGDVLFYAVFGVIFGVPALGFLWLVIEGQVIEPRERRAYLEGRRAGAETLRDLYDL